MNLINDFKFDSQYLYNLINSESRKCLFSCIYWESIIIQKWSTYLQTRYLTLLSHLTLLNDIN